MRILIVSTFFPPLNSIASHRPYSWARYWTLAGHDVTVLTTEKQEDPQVRLAVDNPGYKVIEVPSPRFLSKLKSGYQAASGGTTLKQRVKKHLFSVFHRLRNQYGIFNACRMPDFTDLWISPAIEACGELESWDVIVSTAGPYATHIVAHELKKKGKAKFWVADYRDLWNGNHAYPGLFPFNRIERFLEDKLLKSADAISTVSERFARPFIEKYGSEKVYIIENGFEPKDLEELPSESFFPDDGKFRVVYTGTVYSGKQDPSPLFEAIRELADDPSTKSLLDHLEVVFVGLNPGNVPELIAKYQVERWVRAGELVSRKEALCMQRDADALLFLPWGDPQFAGVMTGKVYEYLFSRAPIMVLGTPSMEASQKLIVDAGAGDILKGVSEVKEYLLRRLRSEKKHVDNMLREGFISRYTRESLSKKLLGNICGLLKKKPKCSVIIITYNNEKVIHKAMECLRLQTVPADQILISDTGSMDLSYLKQYMDSPHIEVFSAGKNVGFCVGNNEALKRVPCDTDYVLLLNPDAFITPDFIERSIAFMEHSQNRFCAIVTGKVLGYDIEKDKPSGLYDTTGVFQKWYGRWYDRGQGVICDENLYTQVESIPAVCGALMFCRKKALDEVMLPNQEILRSSFYMYKEDIDLSLRLKKRGWQLMYNPELVAYHCRGWSPDRKKMPRRVRLVSARNELLIHMRRPNPFAFVYSLTKYFSVLILDV